MNEKPTDRDLVRELKSAECRCGAPKEPKRTFCRRCYYRLPPRLRSALYNPLGAGYAEAREEAAAYLRGRELKEQLRQGKL